MHAYEIRCFAQRILNPFRGAMHVVRMKWGEAITTDGREWTLYIRGECIYDDLDDGPHPGIIVPDIKYGTWSEDTGFLRAPIRLPTFEDTISLQGSRLLQAVRESAPALPFAFADHHELWLLHAETGHPLALIASHCDHEEAETPPLLRWTPGEAAIACLPELAALRTRVARMAGDAPTAEWFDRRCHALPEGDLDCDALIGQETALDTLRRWQSPATLLLALDSALRRTTERLAARHALRLAELLPLYPEVLQREIITAALVEARLRRSTPHQLPRDEEPLSPFYLEV